MRKLGDNYFCQIFFKFAKLFIKFLSLSNIKGSDTIKSMKNEVQIKYLKYGQYFSDSYGKVKYMIIFVDK